MCNSEGCGDDILITPIQAPRILNHTFLELAPYRVGAELTMIVQSDSARCVYAVAPTTRPSASQFKAFGEAAREHRAKIRLETSMVGANGMAHGVAKCSLPHVSPEYIAGYAANNYGITGSFFSFSVIR